MPECVRVILEWAGVVESAIVIAGVVIAIVLWLRGVGPALLRLGNGLARRKIAIFAKGDNLSSLESLLLDSKLFRKRNICGIAKKVDIGKAEDASVLLVFWPDWASDIDDILAQKRDRSALIIYAPSDQGKIPSDQMMKLDAQRNTTLSNFRGRLLNDIVVSMITTSYEES